jgi:hypothetical protein
MKAVDARILDIAVIDTNVGAGKGYLEFGRVATGLKPVGTFAQDCANSTGTLGGKVGSVHIPQDDRDFIFDNSPDADLITIADVGTKCYIAGRRQVAKTDGGATRSELGTVTEILPNGQVCVQINAV